MKTICHNLLIIFFLTLPNTVNAQSKAAEKRATNKTGFPANQATAVPNDEMVKQRRALGLSTLNSLINDVNQFRDLTLRARSQVRVADTLWAFDTEQARRLFHNAWDSAETADHDNVRRSQEATRQKISGPASPYQIRDEVLRFVARRDRALADELLEKLTHDKKKEDATRDQGRNSILRSWGMSEATMQRLELATGLLKEGDVQRAVQFAEPALATASAGAVEFLTALRDRNALEADRRYAAMLANAVVNPQSDANTVSLLSSYLFTPHLIVVFNSQGAQMTIQTSAVTAPVDSSELRASFFYAATQILVRPLPQPERDVSTAGVEGKYLLIKRLLPLFERYAPKETIDVVRTQLQALGAIVAETVRDRDVQKTQIGITQDDRNKDREQRFLEQIDHARISAERDDLYVQLALLIAEKGETRARDLADKIDENELRKSLRAFIDASLVIRAISKKDSARALELARTAQLTHIQRVWVVTQAAKLILKDDGDKSLRLIEDALAEARRIDGPDPDRPRALLAVANRLMVLDSSRALQVVVEAIRAANSADGFTGEDGQLKVSFRGRGLASIQEQSVPDFDVAGIFELIARDDYYGAIELARGFQAEAPRVTATLAVSRSVLAPNK
jgi:hypothetical protein